MKKYKRAYKLREFLPIYESRNSEVVKVIMPLMELRKHEPIMKFKHRVMLFRNDNIIKAYFNDKGKIKYIVLNKLNKVLTI
jgi:hypothetical protein